MIDIKVLVSAAIFAGSSFLGANAVSLYNDSQLNGNARADLSAIVHQVDASVNTALSANASQRVGAEVKPATVKKSTVQVQTGTNTNASTNAATTTKKTSTNANANVTANVGANKTVNASNQNANASANTQTDASANADLQGSITISRVLKKLGANLGFTFSGQTQ